MSASHDSDSSTENCNYSEDGWCQCQSNTGCLTSLDCTGWRPWGNAATGICPGPCQCEEEQAWNSVVPPRPNYHWVKNFIELRRQWSDHARKNFIKFNQVPKSKNSTLPAPKPTLPTTSSKLSSQTPHQLTEDKPTGKSPSNEITFPYSSDLFHATNRHYSLQDSQELSLAYKRKKTSKNSTHNLESPIPNSCCRQSATNSPSNVPFPRSGNNLLYPRPEGGCLCQPIPTNGSSPIRIDVRAIKECTCECPFSPKCACPPSERRFLPVKKHCPNSRLCQPPMFRLPLGLRCRCTKCQKLGSFPVPCNPCTATKCSVGQKECSSFKNCKVDKDIPVKIIDIKIDQDQSTLGKEETTIKRQVSYNDTVEIREDVIDLLYLFPVENQEDPPIDNEHKVVIENKENKVKSCPEGCGARCLVRCGLKVSQETIKGIDKINKQDIKAIDADGKEEIELRGVSDSKGCRRQCGPNFCSNDVSFKADDDKIEIKGIDIGTEVVQGVQGTNWVNKEIQAIDGDGKEEINLSEGFSDGKGCKKRCDAKCSSKDVRLYDDKVEIQLMDGGKEIKLKSVYEGNVYGNKCRKKYDADESKETLTIDKLPIVTGNSTGKCKAKCSERCRENKGSKDDFLKKERTENEEIKELERGEKDGESLESDEWTFVDVECKNKPIKLLKAIDEKKNPHQHQELFDYVVVKFVKRVSTATDSVVVVNKIFRPSYSFQGFGDEKGENLNSDGMIEDLEDMADESILSFQGIDDHQIISTMEILPRLNRH